MQGRRWKRLRLAGLVGAIGSVGAALVLASTASPAAAITNTPVCHTDQMTGKIDCGGGPSIVFIIVGVVITLVLLGIYSAWRDR
jgi:hypothetical protein